MALLPDELFGDAVSQTPNLRAYPHEDGIAVGTLGTLSGDAELPHLTALTFSGGEWLPWADADTTKVDGLLWAPDEAHQGLLASETHIQVFKIGLVHIEDVALPAGQTQGTLTAALKTALTRSAGLIVQGGSGVA
ncbi:MAG: hypothetical protein GKR86_15030 [Ilumatobacter sp.]|nr:hypothetical protein [Ilumatobacter sp.]